MSVRIIQGEDKSFTVRITNENGDPIDLTTITEIETCFRKTDGSDLALSFTGGQISKETPEEIGKIKITVASADSVDLEPVYGETLEITLTDNTSKKDKLQIEEAYTVIEGKC